MTRYVLEGLLGGWISWFHEESMAVRNCFGGHPDKDAATAIVGTSSLSRIYAHARARLRILVTA